MSERKLLLALADLMAMNLALAIALAVGRQGIDPESPALLWFVVLSAVWILVAPAFSAYDLKTASDLRTGVFAGWRVVAVVVTVYFLIPYLSAPLLASRAMMLAFAAAAIILVTAWRWGYASLVSQPKFRVRAMVLGAGRAGESLVDAIESNAPHGYELVGFLDDNPAKWGLHVKGLPVLAPPQRLVEMLQSSGVQELIVATSHEMRAELDGALVEAFESGIRIVSMDDVYEAVTSRIAVQHVGHRWFITLPARGSASIVHELIRRGLDIATGLVGTVLFALLYPPIALVIKMDSSGPVLYAQERVGLKGRRFRLMKFRSMRSDAERDGIPVWAAKRDPRVTRVGRILRSTRLDELPQFLSILRGEMSLIGPRPERPAFVERLQAQIPFYRGRLLVRPGLTGWAQVMYHYGNSTEDALTKLQYDLYYVKHQSFYLDFLVILRTVGVVLKRTGT